MPCFLNFWPWLKPLVLGGMVSSLLHVLVVTPVIFSWLREREIRRGLPPVAADALRPLETASEQSAHRNAQEALEAETDEREEVGEHEPSSR